MGISQTRNYSELAHCQLRSIVPHPRSEYHHSPVNSGNSYRSIMAPQKERWTTKARSILSSAADITGDWLYYKYFIDLDDDPRIDNDLFGYLLLAFSIISTVCGSFSIAAAFGLRFCYAGTKTGKFAEMLIEDIPQMILTSLITYRLGGAFSPRAVLNITTSGYNFFLDLFDISDLVLDQTGGSQNGSQNDLVLDQTGGSQNDLPMSAVTH